MCSCMVPGTSITSSPVCPTARTLRTSTNSKWWIPDTHDTCRLATWGKWVYCDNYFHHTHLIFWTLYDSICAIEGFNHFLKDYQMSDNVYLPINLQLLVFSRMFVHRSNRQEFRSFFWLGRRIEHNWTHWFRNNILTLSICLTSWVCSQLKSDAATNAWAE